MTDYAIGDLHGCLDPLHRLLDKISFDPPRDRLWFVGDIVNRGPQSLESLRFVKSLGDSALTVLGNHDLHLLAVLHQVRKPSSKDTLDFILTCHDKEELIDWIRHQSIMHWDEHRNIALVHAGIHPHWSLPTALAEASALENTLRRDDYAEFLIDMYGNSPRNWSKTLSGTDRLRFAVNVFTRMRYCQRDGTLDFTHNGPPTTAPPTLLPWHSAQRSEPIGASVIFGHWSSHPAIAPPHLIPIDRGCVWGGSLVAFDIDHRRSIWVNRH